MALLGANDFFVLEKNTGEVKREGLLTHCETEIRFSPFPRLEECNLQWRPKAESLFMCTNLKRLFVDVYEDQSSAASLNLRDLESWTILNPVENVGLAPLGADGQPIVLHHVLQTQNGPLLELTTTQHREASRILHINPNTVPSGINRRNV